MKFDSLVIGGGLAGMVCGIRCAQAGLKTGIVSKGESGLSFASGTIDVLGHDTDGQVLLNPFEGIEQLIAEKPDHPYAKTGIDAVKKALSWFQDLSGEFEMPCYPVSEGVNHQRITALGVLRPTYLAPDSMTRLPLVDTARDLRRIAVVNIEGFRDFQPELAAMNLRRLPELAGVEMTAETIRLPSSVMNDRDTNAMRSLEVSRYLDNDKVLSVLAQQIKKITGPVDLVLIPSVLSLHHGIERTRQLSEMLGCRVCELATLPPSLPGIRLANRLTRLFNRLGGVMMPGEQVLDGEFVNDRLDSLNMAHNRQVKCQADHVVLATGSFMSGGLAADRQRIHEAVFGLDTNTSTPRSQWANQHFLDAHAFASFGVVTDQQLRPRRNGQTIKNLFCAGGVLGDAQPLEEGSSGGISITTGWKVAEQIIQIKKTQQGENDNDC
ncbi:glycerol-3-phosphate dehydrogenase subunit GlpB [Endozoicomonas sp. 4G]|uniref:glycerol-3-phosphate dehydrogenase subunit GlpB n=1 Tax=Endozoicomonas sp. 4G TaxID=2872754 RepID=UPI002078F288|nr:glycerol-3-phosphate dehydrogenase subunit GlpB [Endozoicomonas sp. 4G]